MAAKPPVPASLADAPTSEALHAELRALIASSRQRLAGAVNAELTRLYWAVGERLRSEVLGGERARYGDKLMARLGDQLAQEFGRGFEAKNLRRMVQFAQAFPDREIVASVMRQLSWTHFLQLLPLKTAEARHFYAHQAVTERWSVRELRQHIERKAYERTALASSQGAGLTQALGEVLLAPANDVAAPAASADLIFKDPYFLDFLGLRQVYDDADSKAQSCASSKPSSSSWAGALRL